MTLTYTVRPISDRTSFTGPPLAGDRFPFRRSTWASTLDLLERELDHLRATRVVIEIDVRDQDLRVDGTLRANARTPSSPAVRIAFETPDGPMQFATDRYGWNYSDESAANGWQHNVRAIALGLEALRKVDRYGITRAREQYRGFRALPPGTGVEPTGMTVDLAIEVLYEQSAEPRATGALPPDRPSVEQLRDVIRCARACSHPDRNNGERSRWDAVDQAEQVLRRAGRL